MASSLTFFPSLFPAMVIEALPSCPCRRWHRRQAGFPSSLCRLWWLLGRASMGFHRIIWELWVKVGSSPSMHSWAKTSEFTIWRGNLLNKHPASSSYSRVSFGIFWMGRSWTYWDLIGEYWGYPKMDTGNLDWSTKNGDGIPSEYHGIISEWLIHLIPTSCRDVSVDCGFWFGQLFPKFLNFSGCSPYSLSPSHHFWASKWSNIIIYLIIYLKVTGIQRGVSWGI